MKISNKKMLEDSIGLAELAKKELPIKVAYAIAKNLKKVNTELDVYNAEREKLVERFGEKNEDGKLKVNENQQITIKKEYLIDWNKSLKELGEIENEVDFHKFSFSLLENYMGGTLCLSASDFMVMEYMIED